MTLAVTIAGTALSLAVIGWSAANDPKRRRAFGLPPRPRAVSPRTAWAAALLPGFLVALWGGAGGFFVWIGAVIVSGWCLAARRPPRPTAGSREAARPARHRLTHAAESGLDHAPGDWRPLQGSNPEPAD